MLKDISAAIGAFIDKINEVRQPHEIVVNYPIGSPAEGALAGRFVLDRSEKGSAYRWVDAPRAVELEEDVAELVEGHTAKALGSLIDLLQARGDEYSAIFVNATPFGAAQIVAPLHLDHPKRGSVRFEARRHPSWMRWHQAVGPTLTRDLTHEQLADLMLDNQEDLAQPQIAQVLASFRAAKTVEYDGDYNTSGGIGVRVAWGGAKGGESVVAVPRSFVAALIPFAGVWDDESQAPREVARFTLRVLPPARGTEDAAPRFRITWVNAAEYELRAGALLAAKVAQIAPNEKIYLGTYEAKRYVLPTE